MAAAQAPPGPAKSYLVYDQYGLQQADGSVLLFADDGSSVTEFKQNNVMLHTIDKKSLDAQRVPYLLFETGMRTYNVASELSQKFSVSLLKILLKIEAEEKCIQDFRESHIRVSPDGNVKLKGINLQSKTDMGKAAYDVQLEANYLIARTTIQNLFRIVPFDVSHLLHLMATEFASRDLFPQHASLQSLGVSHALFKDFHDLLMVKVDDQQYHKICQAVISVFGGADWRSGVKNNKVLMETYCYTSGGLRYELPYNTPNQMVLRLDQEAELLEVCLPVNPLAKKLTKYELEVIDGHKLLTFLRNRLAHRMEAMDTANKKSGQNLDFSPLHSELLVLVKFPSVLAVIQHQLYCIGYRRAVSLF